MSTTQTPEVARSDVYTDAEALAAAAKQIALYRTAIQRMAVYAAAMSKRAAGTKGLEQGFIAMVSMAEDALEAIP